MSKSRGQSQPEPHYTIVRSDYLEDLTNEVNARIKQGYRPCGGLAVGEKITYLQAMFHPGDTDGTVLA